jgi:hypothetical protein
VSDEAAPALADYEKRGLTADEWTVLIQTSALKRSAPIKAVTFIKRWQTDSRPALLSCEDGKRYVVKQKARVILNDQVVARLGKFLGAPTGEVAFIDVPIELIAAEPEMQGIQPMVFHGNRWIDGCTEYRGIMNLDLPANRTRFAFLAILYGWTLASDHQYIFRDDPPRLVYSVDHGHFFPGGPSWTIDQLHLFAPALPDPTIMSSCNLQRSEIGC